LSIVGAELCISKLQTIKINKARFPQHINGNLEISFNKGHHLLKKKIKEMQLYILQTKNKQTNITSKVTSCIAQPHHWTTLLDDTPDGVSL
jgi:hypothetical protein